MALGTAQTAKENLYPPEVKWLDEWVVRQLSTVGGKGSRTRV